MSVLLDSSFILAFDNEIDVHHQKTLPLWNKIANLDFGQYFISDHIFDEIVAVSLRKRGKEKTIELCQRILNDIPIINVNHPIFEKTKTNLSFTDCTNLVLLKLMGSNLIATFDKEFNKIKGINICE